MFLRAESNVFLGARAFAHRVALLSAFVRVVGCVGIALWATPVRLGADADPAALFAKKCSGCHTFGKGEKVGPDLKGVTERRSRNWLTEWIRSPERTIKSGDPIATALFKKYRQERMPDHNFAPEEITALIDYLAAGGPEATDGSRPRHAMTATPADVTLGRQLFLGAISPRRGGAPCAACHMVGQQDVSTRATFGGDLTHVYSRFQDAGLSMFLKQPCIPRVSAAGLAAPLTDAESFAIKAFLRQVDQRQP